MRKRSFRWTPRGRVGGATLLALDKMGLTDQIKPNVTWVPGGREVQTSPRVRPRSPWAPISATCAIPGSMSWGRFLPEAATPVDITGFLSTNVKDQKAALSLLDYLKSSQAAPVWRTTKVFSGSLSRWA